VKICHVVRVGERRYVGVIVDAELDRVVGNSIPTSRNMLEQWIREHEADRIVEAAAESVENDMVRTVSNAVLRAYEGREYEVDLEILAFPSNKLLSKTILCLLGIPRGNVISYKALAKAIGLKRGWRTAGRLVSLNPFSLIVPCHRVVRSNGFLGGYYWGMEEKRRILENEGVIFKSRYYVHEKCFFNLQRRR